MTFNKPTFVKPDSNLVTGLDYSDIYVDSLKIGSLTKTRHVKLCGDHKEKEIVSYTYDLEVLYKKYQFKEYERKQIIFTIELEYTRAVFHVLASVGDVDKYKALVDSMKSNEVITDDELKRQRNGLRDISEMKIKE